VTSHLGFFVGDTQYAIRWAAESGHDQVILELIKDPRVDPSAFHNCAIQEAAENGKSLLLLIHET
jgi:hypothetical protein